MVIQQRPSCVSDLVQPFAGGLVDAVVDGPRGRELAARSRELASVPLSPRSLNDLELLATGGFSPLASFMGRADYARVVGEMRLAGGTLFPIPITLPVTPGEGIKEGAEVGLRGAQNELLAVMQIQELYEWDVRTEAGEVCGTTDTRHPLVAEMHGWSRTYAAGPLEVVALPWHHDFTELRRTPRQVRTLLEDMGARHVVAFQTRNPLHRAHEELTKRAAAEVDGVLLLHPVVGLTKPGDVDHYTRVRSYRRLVARHYDPRRTVLSLLPLAMRMAGPREAVWHAIVRRNYGASHFIVGRDHAGPGTDSRGKPFYEPYAAQELVERAAPEIGVQVVPFKELVYLPGEDRYEEASRVAGAETASLSGTQVREEFLGRGRPLPAWFTRPETAAILAELSPPRNRQGVCVWFTGLSGAGKSTIADIVTVRLLERGRTASVLDGDVVRTLLSKGLGFSKEDRDLNIRRIGWVAAEVVRHNGVAICSPISPYEATRNEVRGMVGPDRFILVYVATSLEECEARDPKGLYARARRGELTGFTGIDDPYEPPAHPDLVLSTAGSTPEASAQAVLDLLIERGFVDRAD